MCTLNSLQSSFYRRTRTRPGHSTHASLAPQVFFPFLFCRSLIKELDLAPSLIFFCRYHTIYSVNYCSRPSTVPRPRLRGKRTETTPEPSPDFLSIRNSCRRRQQHLARDQLRNRCHHFAERVHIRALLTSTSTALRRNTGLERRKEEGIRARKWHLRRGAFQWGGRDLQAMSMTPSEVGTHKLEVPHHPQRR